MKRVEFKKGRSVVETPWLTVDEAAAYCGMARSTFQEKAENVPHGGSRGMRRYDCRVLDQFIRGELPAVPFPENRHPVGRPPGRRRKKTPALITAQDRTVIIDPGTGKAYSQKGV